MKVRYTDHIVGTDGRFGKAVFGQWRGREVARRYVVPNDPRTPAQLSQRQFFGNGAQTWRLWDLAFSHRSTLVRPVKETWRFAAATVPETPQNLYMAHWIERLANVTTTRLFDWIYFNRFMPPPTSIQGTVRRPDIDFVFTIANPPSGFSTWGVSLIGHQAFDPHAATFDGDFNEASATHGEGSLNSTFQGLSAGEWSVIILCRYINNSVSEDSPLRYQYAASPVLTYTV